MDTLIKIKVKMNQNEELYEITILKHDTIKKLKEEIEKKTSIPGHQQKLAYNEKVLKDENNLNDYGIENDAIISLVKKSPNSDTQNQQSNNLPINNNNIINVNFNETGNLQNDYIKNFFLPIFDVNNLESQRFFKHCLKGLSFDNFISQYGNQMSDLMNNPSNLSMLSQMFQNPNTIQMLFNSPQAQSIVQIAPGILNIFKDPKLSKAFLSPETFQAVFKMMKDLIMTNNKNNNANIENDIVNNNVNIEENNVNEGNKIDDNVNDNDKYKDKLEELRDLGFIDEEKNIKLLKKYNGDVESTIEKLFDLVG